MTSCLPFCFGLQRNDFWHLIVSFFLTLLLFGEGSQEADSGIRLSEAKNWGNTWRSSQPPVDLANPWNGLFRGKIDLRNKRLRRFRTRESTPSAGLSKWSCRLVFVSYVMSPLEHRWYYNIGKWQNNDIDWGQACVQARRDRDKFEIWLRHTQATRVVGEADSTVFSYQLYRDTCTGQFVRHYIEPLASCLRSPFFRCFPDDERESGCRRKRGCGKYGLFSLDFLSFPGIEMVNRLAPSERHIFFDLGTFNFSAGINGYAPSLKWIMDTYLAKGIHFDLVVSWEGRAVDHKAYWKHVPQEFVPRLVFYNTPASHVVGCAHNVLTQLKIRCHEEDYCAMKLDIDDSNVEEAIIRQLLADEAATKLLDEIFWEHHVTGNPLSTSSWLRNIKNGAQTVEDSYELFVTMRKKGIRAHSWV
mmetsp:Transcript_3687/g.8849  ORF Transcript_3687/g.8849 Transcript_3687/m.8849 type:complete len:416 (-) Transcript_3687:501-1748(-)